MEPRIDEIKVKAILDDNPDTDWIGKYTDRAEDWAICRHCGEYLYHAEMPNRIIDNIEQAMADIAYDMGGLDEDSERHAMLDKIYNAMENALNKFEPHDCPTYHSEYNFFKPYAGGEPEGSKAYIKYGQQDFDRMEALQQGHWHFIGIQAEAIVSYPLNGNDSSRRLEHLTSGGLWGVESDAEDYHTDVAKGELADLKSHLEAFSVDMSNFKELTKDIEIEY